MKNAEIKEFEIECSNLLDAILQDAMIAILSNRNLYSFKLLVRTTPFDKEFIERIAQVLYDNESIETLNIKTDNEPAKEADNIQLDWDGENSFPSSTNNILNALFESITRINSLSFNAREIELDKLKVTMTKLMNSEELVEEQLNTQATHMINAINPQQSYLARSMTAIANCSETILTSVINYVNPIPPLNIEKETDFNLIK